MHSPEFILESLKAGHTPKGVHHDVYCSRCGHLTHFRDHSGNEGGALHIAHATVRLILHIHSLYLVLTGALITTSVV